jgi:hypothetical protein
MLDEFARHVFDKFAPPSKAAISAFLLDEFAKTLKLCTLLDSINAPLQTAAYAIQGVH